MIKLKIKKINYIKKSCTKLNLPIFILLLNSLKNCKYKILIIRQKTYKNN